MGNYKLRLSDMIPNSWFHKLRNHNFCNKKQPSRKPNCYNSPTNPKPSHTHCPDPPRKSPKRNTIYKPSPTTTHNSVRTQSQTASTQDYFLSSTDTPPLPKPDSDTIHVTQSQQLSSSATDTISEIQLPPILTKPPKSNDAVLKKNTTKEAKSATVVTRKSVSCSSGVKLRANSPRVACKKGQVHGRKPPQPPRRGSFAMVKSSLDPERDFRESMMEMIVENHIRGSKDLEELLACYLLLNLDEYHHLIVKAFQQIWFYCMLDLHM